MKRTIYILMISIAIISLSSCEKPLDTENLSGITYYPEFTLEGDDVMLVKAGEEFQEPGVTAKEGENEIPVTVSVRGIYFDYKGSEVNTSMGDKYIVTYSAENSDGFEGTATRTVYVVEQGDLINSIAGLYTSTVVRNGTVTPETTDMEYVFISHIEDNKYVLSDGIGGYYDLGRAYGPAYATADVIITANDIPSNDFSFNNPFPVGTFGGEASITSMTVNPATKTISFKTEWSEGYTFEVKLTQVEI